MEGWEMVDMGQLFLSFNKSCVRDPYGYDLCHNPMQRKQPSQKKRQFDAAITREIHE
jgi:hypothetical protein